MFFFPHNPIPIICSDMQWVIGSMALYVSDPSIKKFQPMNANFGIVSPIEGRFKGKNGKKEKNSAIADRALEHLKAFEESLSKITGQDF